MFDTLKVVFILTSTSTYLVTKYIKIGTSSFDQPISDYGFTQILSNGSTNGLTQGLTSFYEISIFEEEIDLPKKLLHLKAVPIGSGSNDVMYILSGDGVLDDYPENSSFAINAFSGELFLVKKINRDPPDGNTLFQLNITAEDDRGQHLEGLAQILIKVKDINDNSPQFSQNIYFGFIEENNEIGVDIIRVLAIDNDENDIIRYSIEMNKVDSKGHLMFEINELSGQILSSVCCLDREAIDFYLIKVCAHDSKHKNCCHLNITITDQNDNFPKFIRNKVSVEMTSRELKSGKVVTNVSVSDRDLISTNNFTFSVVQTNTFSKFFSVISSNDMTTALLVITSDIDLETQVFTESIFYDISISVSVIDSPEVTNEQRFDYCYITLRVIRLEEQNSTERVIFVNSTHVSLNTTEYVSETRISYTKHMIIVSAIILVILVIVIIVIRRRPHDNTVEEWNATIGHYNLEGGESENFEFDLSHLQIPVHQFLLPDVCNKKY